MPDSQHHDDLAATAIRMVLGAGESIVLKAKHVDGREFGLCLEDLANSVDNRLSLRCLLPLPGIYRDRDGSVHKEREVEDNELDSLKRSVALLEDAGWQVRLIPDSSLISSLSVDNDAVIYYSYLNNPPGPFFSEDSRDVAHYLNQFENSWATSFEVSSAENLYDASRSFIRATETAQIAIVSHEAWTTLIFRLSKNPELLHDLPPRKFEELVAELLSREGLEVHLTPKTRDGGRDVLAFHQTPVGRLLYLVECKRHLTPVGIAIVQRLYGVVAQERATAGLVVTTSRFSKEALTFAETVKHQLGLKDYENMKIWLRKHGTV
ncbi:restriction endonuclease [Candidatus Bathyarchaeota archaeon]|nr:restriction endonuclease [Candidatus Bathyarchaeota archaeon]